MNLRKTAASAGAAVAGAIVCTALVSACGSGNPQADDLQNVPPSYPNYAAIYMNVDGFPNVVELCVNGIGFATTTREAAGAIMRVPEWDAFCAKQVGKQATQNGQP